MSAFITPLRYPGGKGRLGPWLSELLRFNSISGGWYVEPYAGGAGAALFLLMRGYVNHIVINDIDPAIHAFWWSILNRNEDFLHLLEKTDVTMENWYEQKKIIENNNDYEPLAVGFAAFFLNRTNRSGILKGGVVGGKRQNGAYKIDARFNKVKLAERIKNIGKMRTHISLYNLDAIDLIDRVEHKLPKSSLVYLDPPYYIKGSQLYRNHYKHDDHEKIAERVKKLSTPVLVTYDNCEQIREIYQGEKVREFSFHYSTHLARPRITEIMIYKNIELHKTPSMVKKK
ncbi:DNA adenine methylase [Serratia marcescens]|uniref:DNA adenine methylase n=1 Tax=Serratia nevei TaxID=2703794 RepID=UPI001A355F04|nr:DNA adenine methylase [Serratia marcescens]ELQ9441955.1 DNA adenine methylase [Serratia marcescens]ELT5562481.1 DNA adenine methylase [Serratia marcescens]HAT4993755.1 DNA adenine methylase [Serratia marcescens]